MNNKITIENAFTLFGIVCRFIIVLISACLMFPFFLIHLAIHPTTLKSEMKTIRDFIAFGADPKSEPNH